jgi:hypothetical protein
MLAITVPQKTLTCIEKSSPKVFISIHKKIIANPYVKKAAILMRRG